MGEYSTHINYLRITTEKGSKYSIGYPDKFAQEFKLNIYGNERPVALFGVLAPVRGY